MKRKIMIIIASVIGFIMVFDYVIQYSPLQTITVTIQSWIPLMVAFTVGLGFIGINRKTVNDLIRRKNLIYNGVLISTMWITILVGLGLGTTSPAYLWIFTAIMETGGTAVYALLGFYMLSASLRAFQMRTPEGIAMGIIALITIFASTTIAESISPAIPQLSSWLYNVPISGAATAMMIGLGLGTVGFMIRVLIGKETSWVGEA